MADVYRLKGGVQPVTAMWGPPTTFQTLLCDQAGEGVAAIVTMPVDDTITAIGFRNSSKAGTPVDDTWTAGIQGVTAGGLPDDTYLGGGSPTSVTLPGASGAVGTYGTGTYHFLTLANTIALQAGTDYALVVQKTGADDTTNTLTFSAGMNAGGAGVVGKPYLCTAAAGAPGAWSKATRFPLGFALRSSTRTYFFPCLTVRASQTVGTTTEKGFSFVWDTAFGTSNSLGVRGVELFATSMTAGGTITANLYSDPTGTPVILQTTGQLDSDIVGQAANLSICEMLFTEDTLSTLNPGTTYGIGISASQAAAWGLYRITLPDANSRDAYPMGGLTYLTRTLASAYPPDNSDGAFSATTTTIVMADLILADFTVAASSGSGFLIT